MPGRNSNIGNYRYAYNGMEVDPEMKGNGNEYTTEYRQYDPRLGRWMSLDPLKGKFPWMSPYVAFDDNPILFTDPLGLEATGDYFDPTTKKKLGTDHQADGKVYYINKQDWIDLKANNPELDGHYLELEAYGYGAKEVYGAQEKYELMTDRYGERAAAKQYHSESVRPAPASKPKPQVIVPGQPTIGSPDKYHPPLQGDALESYESSKDAQKNMPAFYEFSVVGDGIVKGAPIAMAMVGQEYFLYEMFGIDGLLIGSESATVVSATEIIVETTVAAEENISNIAFGLNDDLFNFAEANGFQTYRDFSTGFQKDLIESTIQNSNNQLHFNLNGFSKYQYSKFNPSGPITSGNITNWELNTIINTPGALARTTFYRFSNGSYYIVPFPF